MAHTRTDEQELIVERVKSAPGNLMLNALAGCGKTSTLEMIEASCKVRPILYLVFNKKNAEEAEERLQSTTTVRTFNSLGHRIWGAVIGRDKLRVAPKKTQEDLVELIKSSPSRAQGPMWECMWDVIHGVGLAKSLGYVPEGIYPHAIRLQTEDEFHASLDERPDLLTAELINKLLAVSIKSAYAGRIDYNDQIYMPALFGGTYPQFPLVMVDEIQDLNPVNHQMLRKLNRSRIIGVGDPWQSIYGFRGAVRSGMSRLRDEFGMEGLDLSISFRCPQAIVEHARWRVPNFKWIKEGGSVETPKTIDPDSITDNAAIISRNNAPLFSFALRLLGSGRSVSVAGSDIGPKLIGMMRKLGPSDMTRNQLRYAIEAWKAEKIAKGSTSAADMAECMLIFASHGENLSQAISYAEHLFKQRGSIKLLTGHKSKGLEFDTVYHLDPFLCKDEEQDLNLRYVITTRSANRLVEINSDQVQW